MVVGERAQNVPAKRLLSIRELAKEYGSTVWYWRSQVWLGRLPVVQVGRKQLVDVVDVEEFIRGNKR